MHQYRQLGSRTTAGEGGRTVNRDRVQTQN